MGLAGAREAQRENVGGSPKESARCQLLQLGDDGLGKTLNVERAHGLANGILDAEGGGVRNFVYGSRWAT
jgi:hypothetical protein